MIGNRDEYGVKQAGLTSSWQTSLMQQEDRFGKSTACHQSGDIVAANPEMCLVRSRNGRSPSIHEPSLSATSVP